MHERIALIAAVAALGVASAAISLDSTQRISHNGSPGLVESQPERLIEVAGPSVPPSAFEIVSKLKEIDGEDAGKYSEDKHLRWNTNFALLKELEHAGPAVMVRMLGDKDPYVRACAADVLGVSEERRAIDSLIATLRDCQPIVRSCSALALGRIRHRRAVPALIQAMQDEHHGVRAQSARALGQIASPAATAALIKSLKEEGSGQSCNVYTPMVIVAMWKQSHPGPYNEPESWALAQIGPPAVNELAAALKDSAGTNHVFIAWSLSIIALDHRDTGAINSLMAARDHADPNIRDLIAETLTKIEISTEDGAERQ